MNIDDYMQALERSSDEDAEHKLGMYDNFIISLNGDIRNILSAELFKEKFLNQRKNGDYHFYDDCKGSVVQIFQFVAADLPDIFQEINFKKYDATISLHLGEAYIRGGVEALKDITKIAQNLRMPFCLPFTTYCLGKEGPVIWTP